MEKPGPTYYAAPLGSVLPYAGQLTNEQLNAQGWQLCDGSPLPVAKYPALFELLGTLYGGDGNTHFNAPDYRGLFLRGLDPAGKVDRDAATRTPVGSGAAWGPTIGSVQACATAPGINKFYVDVPAIPQQNLAAQADLGANKFVAATAPGPDHLVNAGGDLETRPINAYVHFIIKIDAFAHLPVGFIVIYAGNKPDGSPLMVNSAWCEGERWKHEDDPKLYPAIGNAHGGDDVYFYLPDYRGRFLRGVDGTANRDPDHDNRAVMHDGGNKGNAVGSIQEFATARPNTPFVVHANLSPYYFPSMVAGSTATALFNPDTVDLPFPTGGSDLESRPVNISIEHYIYRLPPLDPRQDSFPVGAIIGFPSNTPADPSAWLLCDGAPVSTATYPELFAAIRYDNGGSGATFNVPDYRGYFLRGKDRYSKRDPDADKRVAAASGGQSGDNVGSRQGYATGPAKTPMVAKIPHLVKNYALARADGQGLGTVGRWDAPLRALFTGGDLETRPINASIHFYIKYRQLDPVDAA